MRACNKKSEMDMMGREKLRKDLLEEKQQYGVQPKDF